jgi:hypothetical protein
MASSGPLAGQKFSRDPLGVAWIHGSMSAKHNTDPDLQVHWYDEHTVILRQNKAIDYEAPFLYLLLGSQRAVLLDTGATASPVVFPVRQVVDELVLTWLAATLARATSCSYCTPTRTTTTLPATGSSETVRTPPWSLLIGSAPGASWDLRIGMDQPHWTSGSGKSM